MLRQFLENGDIAPVLDWAESTRNPMRWLISLAYDSDPKIKWQAIALVGRVAGSIAKDDPNKIRDLIRRQLWLMNDESGGLGWSAPEIIGEILVNAPEFIFDFGALLLSFLKEEPFERGSHWAIYRVATVNPGIYRHNSEELIESLKESDRSIILFTLMSLEQIDGGIIEANLSGFASDTEPIEYFDNESMELKQTTLKEKISAMIAEGRLADHAA